MSTIMVGVLSMPDELFWSDDPIARVQHNAIRLQAAKRILKLEAALEKVLQDSDCGVVPRSHLNHIESLL